jgi:hypothetical protein
MASDMLIGKNGESVRGAVLTKSFTISGPLGNITVPTSRIKKITFYFKPQEILLTNQDTLTGTIKEKTIRFRQDGGPTADVPTSALLMTLIGWLLSSGASLKAHFE